MCSLELLQKPIHPSFFKCSEMGVGEYRRGNWSSAKQYLEYAIASFQPAKDSLTPLLDFMNETKFVPPHGWHGVRSMTDGGH